MGLDTVYEMVCDDCGSKFEIATTDDNEHDPMYCPFCGNEFLEEAEYDDEEDDTYSEEEFKDFIDKDE